MGELCVNLVCGNEIAPEFLIWVVAVSTSPVCWP